MRRRLANPAIFDRGPQAVTLPGQLQDLARRGAVALSDRDQLAERRELFLEFFDGRHGRHTNRLLDNLHRFSVK